MSTANSDLAAAVGDEVTTQRLVGDAMRTDGLLPLRWEDKHIRIWPREVLRLSDECEILIDHELGKKVWVGLAIGTCVIGRYTDLSFHEAKRQAARICIDYIWPTVLQLRRLEAMQ